MRTLKFRAWNEKLKCMSEVLELDFQHDAIRCVPGHLPKNKLSDCILLQSTGLHDKNGKEIYEGDCLGGSWDKGYIGYCDKCKGFQYFMPLHDGCARCSGDVHWEEVVEDDGLEVIGNIYENPDLLTK